MENKIKFLFFFFLIMMFQSCFLIKNRDFDAEDLKWLKPFSEDKTVIYHSEKNEFDTIFYSKYKDYHASVRDIERGFYDENSFSIRYKLSKGSYHQFADVGDLRESGAVFLSIANSSLYQRNHADLIIYFLGIRYDDDSIKNISKIDEKILYFDVKKATYPEINISEGISNFTYNLDSGVVEFLDNRNVKWKRK